MRPLLDICRFFARKASRPHGAYRRLVSFIPVSETQLRDFFEGRRFFFIVSTGRTGSAWLSRVLNTDPRTFVEHEPVLWEQAAHLEAIVNARAADEYIRDFRRKHMYLRWTSRSRPEVRIVGEVNSAVRRHIEPLRKYLPGVTFIHVVRDGRDFVRSVMSRGTYAGNHPVYRNFVPPPIDEYAARWESLTEFEKSCWAWSWSNRDLRNLVGTTVRFEDLLASYDDFSEYVLKPLGIDVSAKIWEESVRRPANRTSNYLMGKWDTWTEEERHTFCEICGDEMLRNGYALPAEYV